MTIPLIPCPSCDFTLKPVWFLEKELDNHGILENEAPSVLWWHPQNGCLLSLRAIAGDDQIAQWDTRYGETAGKSNVNCEER